MGWAWCCASQLSSGHLTLPAALSSSEQLARLGSPRTAAPASPFDATAPLFPLGERRASERLSAATLLRLRLAVLQQAEAEDVRDVYAFGATIGTGGYAIVKLATHKQSGREVAVKVMRLPKAADDEPRPASPDRTEAGSLPGRVSLEEDVLKEVEVLKSINHPNCLKMHSYFLDYKHETAFLVTDYLAGGELLTALLARGSYSESDARCVFRPILEGVAYLHDQQVTHRDLKLENLLLRSADDLSSVVISDFGLAKASLMSAAHELDPAANPWTMDLKCGTLAYCAPEVLSARQYTSAIDLWSCGVILYILLGGVVPFEGSSERHIVANILAGRYSLAGPEMAAVSDEAKSLISGLLCVDPRRRLRARQALAVPWLSAPAAPAPTAAPPPLARASQRLKMYAQRAKPPERRFAAGEYLVRRGQRATELYLIRSGACELLLEEPPGEEAEAPAAAPPAALGRRGAGDIVGEQGVIVDEKGRFVRVAAPDAPLSPRAEGAEGTSRAEARWLTPLLARKFAKRWVGRRRTVSVRALTEVRAVVLQRRDMGWVMNIGLPDRADTVSLALVGALDRLEAGCEGAGEGGGDG